MQDSAVEALITTSIKFPEQKSQKLLLTLCVLIQMVPSSSTEFIRKEKWIPILYGCWNNLLAKAGRQASDFYLNVCTVRLTADKFPVLLFGNSTQYMEKAAESGRGSNLRPV